MKIEKLVSLANFFDEEGLIEEADYIDSLIKEAQTEKSETEMLTESEPEVDEGTVIQNDLKEVNKIKRRFVEKFYKRLLDAHNKIRNTVNEDNFGYLGDERRQILKISFDALINAMQDEFRKFHSTITANIVAKVVNNTKVIKDVYKLFTPILDLHDEFENFMMNYPEFAERFPRTKTTFLNLKNVINNIIKNVPEEILDIDLTKK